MMHFTCSKIEQECVTNRRSIQANKVRKQTIFKRAESYAKEYLQQEREAIRLSRAAKAANNFYVPPEAKLAFVIRIRGINKIAPKPKKILQLFRLLQLNNGVFIKLNKATTEMLKVIEPYVAFG